MRWAILLLALALACGGDDDSGGGRDGGGGGGGDGGGGGGDGGGGGGGEGLVVQGNRIVHADGRPFRGRGANLHDMRSCNACSYAPPEPDGIDRWADELI